MVALVFKEHMETQTAVVIESTPVRVAPKNFYSRSSALVVRVSKGQQVLVNGKLERIGEKILEFSALGAGQYGGIVTDDPEAIALLEARAALSGSDVMTAEQFNAQLIPDKDKVTALQAEDERKDREIQEKNRIIADLMKNQKDKPQTVRN